MFAVVVTVTVDALPPEPPLVPHANDASLPWLSVLAIAQPELPPPPPIDCARMPFEASPAVPIWPVLLTVTALPLLPLPPMPPIAMLADVPVVMIAETA